MTDSHSENDIWQSHCIKFLESAFRTDRQEVLHQPDGCGKGAIDCGDHLELFIVLDESRIAHIAYATNGCMNTNACANALIDLAQGRTLDDAVKISPQDVFIYLETLPEEHFHCAELAVEALKAAIADTHRNRHAAWKKPYRNSGI